jgi:hypothetical protein
MPKDFQLKSSTQLQNLTMETTVFVDFAHIFRGAQMKKIRYS